MFWNPDSLNLNIGQDEGDGDDTGIKAPVNVWTRPAEIKDVAFFLFCSGEDQNLIIIILNAINCSAVFITWISKKEKKISWLIQKTKHLIRESKIPSIASRLNPPDVRGCTRPEHKIIRKYCSGNKGVRFTIFSVVCWQFSQIEIWAACH